MKGISTRHLSILAASLLFSACGGGGGGGAPVVDPIQSSFTGVSTILLEDYIGNPWPTE